MYTPTSARSLQRLLRLLDQAHHRADLAGAPVGQLRDAVVLGVGDRGEEDQGVGLVLVEGAHELGDTPLQQVVAEVHHERALAEERLGREHRMGEPRRFVLEHVGEAHAEARAVTGGGFDLASRLGGDDDRDLLDAGIGHRLDPVEQDRLVGHRHQLLGGGVGDRAQPGALAAGEDQALERLHRRRSLAAGVTGEWTFIASVTNRRARSNMSAMSPRDLSRCSDEELLQIGLEDARALGVFYDRYEDACSSSSGALPGEPISPQTSPPRCSRPPSRRSGGFAPSSAALGRGCSGSRATSSRRPGGDGASRPRRGCAWGWSR